MTLDSRPQGDWCPFFFFLVFFCEGIIQGTLPIGRVVDNAVFSARQRFAYEDTPSRWPQRKSIPQRTHPAVGRS